MSQDYQTHQLNTEEGNLSRPIRTGHNQHTHTGNTRQHQLNSRVLRVHPPSRAELEGCHSELNLRNATCLTLIPRSTQGIRSELNSRNTSNPKHQNSNTAAVAIAWRGTRTVGRSRF